MPSKSNGKSAGATAMVGFKTTIDIPDEAREQLCDILNHRLADTADLHSQIKHAHWNVKGKDFYQLHIMYDQLAACALEWSDEIAERIATLGGYVKGTVRMAAAATDLPEFPQEAVEGMDTVQALVASYAKYCEETREGIEQTEELGDPSTTDLLTEVSRDADKNRWFLEAHLQA